MRQLSNLKAKLPLIHIQLLIHKFQIRNQIQIIRDNFIKMLTNSDKSRHSILATAKRQQSFALHLSNLLNGFNA